MPPDPLTEMDFMAPEVLQALTSELIETPAFWNWRENQSWLPLFLITEELHWLEVTGGKPKKGKLT